MARVTEMELELVRESLSDTKADKEDLPVSSEVKKI